MWMHSLSFANSFNLSFYINHTRFKSNRKPFAVFEAVSTFIFLFNWAKNDGALEKFSLVAPYITLSLTQLKYI